MNYAYFRQTSSSSTLSSQQQSVVSYASRMGLELDRDVLEYSSTTSRISNRIKFESFIHSLQDGDLVIVYDLNLLSSYVDEVIEIVNCALSHKVPLHVSKDNFVIDQDTKIIELLQILDLPNENKHEKRAVRGRPKGSRSSSKFDAMRSKIISMLQEKKNVSHIARELDVNRSSLKDYINSRELRDLALSNWMEISQREVSSQRDILLVCPFDKTKKLKESK